MIKTKAGHLIKCDNTQGAETLLIEHSSGSTIKMATGGNVEVKADSGEVKVDAKTINLTASGTLAIEAKGDLTIKGQNGQYQLRNSSKIDSGMEVQGGSKEGEAHQVRG